MDAKVCDAGTGSAIPLRRTAVDSRRGVLIAAAVIAGLAGVGMGYLGARHAGSSGDPDLTLLLRFMAVTKLGMAVAAAWLVDWRLRFPIGTALANAYTLSVALMAAAPGPIWFMDHMVAAAALFHAGLLLGLVLCLADGRVQNSRLLGWAKGSPRKDGAP